jgi:hypothetical protein
MTEFWDKPAEKSGKVLAAFLEGQPLQFSLRDEGSTEYMCVRGKITGDNIYRCQSACPVVLNDFDLFKENKTSKSL